MTVQGREIEVTVKEEGELSPAMGTMVDATVCSSSPFFLLIPDFPPVLLQFSL